MVSYTDLKTNKDYWRSIASKSVNQKIILYLHKFKEFNMTSDEELLDYIEDFKSYCKTSGIRSYKKFINISYRDLKHNLKTITIDKFFRYIYYYIHAKKHNNI